MLYDIFHDCFVDQSPDATIDITANEHNLCLSFVDILIGFGQVINFELFVPLTYVDHDREYIMLKKVNTLENDLAKKLFI